MDQEGEEEVEVSTSQEAKKDRMSRDPKVDMDLVVQKKGESTRTRKS